MKRAILFDLDGVLIDSYEVWRHLVSATAVAFGYAPIPREVFHQTWGQGIRADIERFFPSATLEAVEAFYDAHFLDHLEHLTIFPEGKTVLQRVHEAGLATAIVTNTPRPLAEMLVRRAGLTPDTLVGGTDVPQGKPAPDMVLLACRQLRVTPDEALMVGDTVYDRDAARTAGVRFAGLGIPGDDTLERLEDLMELIGS